MEWIKKVVEQHHKWTGMAIHLGGGIYSEDLVQDMYLKLNQYSSEEKCFTDGRLNEGYIFFVLRSVVFQHSKILNRVKTCHLNGFDTCISEDQLEDIKARNIIENKINNILDDMHWYDAKMFRLYRFSGKSYRKLAKDTGISWVSIYNTIKNVKEVLSTEVGEDYQDYLNKDYERI